LCAVQQILQYAVRLLQLSPSALAANHLAGTLPLRDSGDWTRCAVLLPSIVGTIYTATQAMAPTTGNKAVTMIQTKFRPVLMT
jgi:hypothetical protein